MTKKKRLYLYVKRVQDIVLAALALVFLSPLMLLIALVIMIDDPFPHTLSDSWCSQQE